MIETNSPEVRVSTESGLMWEFVSPSSATTCAEQAEEMVQFCEQLYGAFGEFLVPISITYAISLYEQDWEIRPDDDTGEVKTRELQNEDGISVSEFTESAEFDEDLVRWIPRVPFDRNRYKVHFNGNDYAVERGHCTPYRNGEANEGMIISDPLRISAHHLPSRHYPSVTTDHVLTVSVSMSSDLWLRTSENGQKNREYLVHFFEDISNVISAKSIKRDKYATSDFWNDLSVYSGGDDYIALEPEEIY